MRNNIQTVKQMVYAGFATVHVSLGGHTSATTTSHSTKMFDTAQRLIIAPGKAVDKIAAFFSIFTIFICRYILYLDNLFSFFLS